MKRFNTLLVMLDMSTALDTIDHHVLDIRRNNFEIVMAMRFNALDHNMRIQGKAVTDRC